LPYLPWKIKKLATVVIDSWEAITAQIEREKEKIELLAAAVTELARHDYTMSIDSGQVLWLGVKREERQNYGKNARNTEIVPVKLTLLSPEDIDLLSSGFSTRG
jgi:hypothetical protein